MPTISMFYGIIIRMQSERGGKHHTPHLHAIYGDSEIVVDFNCEILEGEFPKNNYTYYSPGYPCMKMN